MEHMGIHSLKFIWETWIKSLVNGSSLTFLEWISMINDIPFACRFGGSRFARNVERVADADREYQGETLIGRWFSWFSGQLDSLWLFSDVTHSDLIVSYGPVWKQQPKTGFMNVSGSFLAGCQRWNFRSFDLHQAAEALQQRMYLAYKIS